jgi:succinoglycan biosynthesis protein ExoA
VRNEVQYIRRCLQAIIDQTGVPGEMEMIVADGMSDDGTRQILQSLQSDFPHLILIDNPGKIVSTGLNLATRRAAGEILIRVDGHCIIAPDYVSKCVEHLSRDGVDGVGGPMETIGETPLAQTIALAMSSSFGVGNSAFRTTTGKTMLADTVPFPAYTKAIVEKVGPYDEELVRNQDDEYNYRIRAAGGRLLLAADIHSRYYSRATFKQLWRQFYQYGFYKVRVLQKHPGQMKLRQFAPPALVLSLVVSLLFGLFFPNFRSIFSALTAIYLLFLLTASIISATHKNWRYLPLLPLCFATLHWGYGFGFLTGLLKFWNRWQGTITDIHS